MRCCLWCCTSSACLPPQLLSYPGCCCLPCVHASRLLLLPQLPMPGRLACSSDCLPLTIQHPLFACLMRPMQAAGHVSDTAGPAGGVLQ